MSGLILFYGNDHVAFVGADGSAIVAGAKPENRFGKLRRIAEVQDGLIGVQRRRLAQFQVELLGQVIDGNATRAAELARNLSGEIFGLALGFLFLQCPQNLRKDLIERLSAGGLTVDDFDDVESVLRLHQIGNRSDGQAESGLLEFGDRLPTHNPVEIAALIFGGVIGILLGQVAEIAATLGLFQYIFGLFADLFGFGICLADGLEQNVRHMGAFGQFVTIDVLVVIAVDLVLRNIGTKTKLLEIQKPILHDAPLRHVIPRFILLEISGQIGIAGFDFRLQIVGLDDDVADLDF